MAVLPTPGSPISTGLFLVRRDSTWMVRRISSSRPITGSSLPSRAACGEVAGVFLQRVVGCSRPRRSRRCGPCGCSLIASLRRLRRDAGRGENLAGVGVLLDGQRQQQPLDGDEASRRPSAPQLSAVSKTRASSRREIELAGRRRRPSGCLLERRLGLGTRDAAHRRRPWSMRPAAMPSSSSSSTLSRWIGANCWWPSPRASCCAVWMKPRARSVYFSMFIQLSPLARRNRPP